MEHLFAFIDRDRSHSVTIAEMTRGLQSVLSDKEVVVIFEWVDQDKNGSLSFEEVVNAFKEVHTGYVLNKLRQAITNGKLTPEKVFATIASDEKESLDVIKFDELVRLNFQQLKKYEVDSLFAHFDKKGLGKINVQEFKNGLSDRVQLESKLRFYLNDFLTPLQSLIKKSNIAPAAIFDIFANKTNSSTALMRLQDFK